MMGGEKKRKPNAFEKILGFLLIGIALIAFTNFLSEGRLLEIDGMRGIAFAAMPVSAFLVYLQKRRIGFHQDERS